MGHRTSALLDEVAALVGVLSQDAAACAVQRAPNRRPELADRE
jgi:hypothetical protein